MGDDISERIARASLKMLKTIAEDLSAIRDRLESMEEASSGGDEVDDLMQEIEDPGA